MYPNPHILPNAGVYLKHLPGDSSHVEYFILRPDLLVEWSILATDGNDIVAKEMRGNWAIGEYRLMIVLMDDENGESYTERYIRDGQDWRLEEDQAIVLVKRNPADDINDNMYYDLR
ncbi:hypothetical protein [Mucilaginibacter paludis]|uniref:Uncharacterized protein n=1 Tax=Mucilaginibacter paludis DSM 18603 TaxID=714943 RepID=H1XZ75_9SPHI|nr:hypothetical protein [Mucilaginibacter paludis]EHQ24660.1 hypothetical protein Mucpa_0466 [Mucilaginibacter paludis DSM 18603]